MRTFIWFCYFIGYLLVIHPQMHKGLRALKNDDYKKADEYAYKYVTRWCNGLIKLAGVEITVTGEENIPDCPCVFTANHRSLWDIPVMLTSFGHPIPLVSKIEAEKIPLISKWMKLLHCAFLDRSSPRQGLEVINFSANLVRRGYSVGIFPEGTRYKGEEGGIGPFLSGAFRIASKTDAPVVPVAIFNARAIFEGTGRLKMKPGKIQVHILPAIETKGLSRTELKALPSQVQESISAELQKGM